ELMLGATIGRLTAPLVLRLFQAHDSLPAGTAVMVAFAASAPPVAKPKPKDHQQAQARHRQATGGSGAGKHAAGTNHSREDTRRQPPDFPASAYPFRAGGRLSADAQHNDVVSIAMHYLGVPYQWGGASPKTGFDCSGLVTYVFAKLGVSLPHYAASQYYSPEAVWVAPNRLQPGDLVFFVGSDGTRKQPGHVGIYVDDGYIIDAPHTGAFVRIDRLSESRLADGYVGAKRIVGASLAAARHLRHVAKIARPVRALPVMLAPRVSGLASGPSLPLIAADRTAAHTSAPRDYRLWTGIVLGGVLLLLVAGAVTYRRRERAPEAEPSLDTSN
ncbi:MAG TPA: C40 family peptidase, partial [Gaiellaceae bacterium]|nr:C40 family peptidase [Gaiellaceae bacterium]